jgi:hypothetical protein
VTFNDIVSNVLAIPAAQQNANMGKTIGHAMEINGWRKPTGPMRMNGRTVRGYWRFTER